MVDISFILAPASNSNCINSQKLVQGRDDPVDTGRLAIRAKAVPIRSDSPSGIK